MRTGFDNRKVCCKVKKAELGSENLSRNRPGNCPVTTTSPPSFYAIEKLSDRYMHG